MEDRIILQRQGILYLRLTCSMKIQFAVEPAWIFLSFFLVRSDWCLVTFWSLLFRRLVGYFLLRCHLLRKLAHLCLALISYHFCEEIFLMIIYLFMKCSSNSNFFDLSSRSDHLIPNFVIAQKIFEKISWKIVNSFGLVHIGSSLVAQY